MKTLRAFRGRELRSGSLIKVSNKHMKHVCKVPCTGFLFLSNRFCVANHRNIVRSPVLMRELWLQMWHDIQPGAKSKFVTKGKNKLLTLLLLSIVFGCKYKYRVTAKRGPLRDTDCYWDYGKACCAWQEYCEYRFHSPLPIQSFLSYLLFWNL